MFNLYIIPCLYKLQYKDFRVLSKTISKSEMFLI